MSNINSLRQLRDQAEDRVQAALRAVDAAQQELKNARKALIEADRAVIRAELEQSLSPPKES